MSGLRTDPRLGRKKGLVSGLWLAVPDDSLLTSTSLRNRHKRGAKGEWASRELRVVGKRRRRAAGRDAAAPSRSPSFSLSLTSILCLLLHELDRPSRTTRTLDDRCCAGAHAPHALIISEAASSISPRSSRSPPCAFASAYLTTCRCVLSSPGLSTLAEPLGTCREERDAPVSYTHLTLPTIYSV